MASKIVKTTVGLIIGLLLIAIAIRVFLGSTNSISFKIFKAKARGYYVHKVLGIIPSSYQDRFSKMILDSYDDKQVINLVDEMSSSYPNFIVFISGSESKFLKAYPFELVGVKKEEVERGGWTKHVSLLINLDVFNEYVRSKQLKSKDEAIRAYCSFLSNPIDQSTHKILRNASDIDSLITDWPTNNLDFVRARGYNVIDSKSIDFDQPDGTVFCWLYDKGVIRLGFTFNADNAIKSVESEIIGLLGNEVPGI